MRPPAPLTATPGGGPRILTNQLMFDAPGKPNLPAASWHNPLDTESLLGYPGISTIVPIRRAVQPQTSCAERIEAAGAAGVGSAATSRSADGRPFNGSDGGADASRKGLSKGGASGEVGGEVGEELSRGRQGEVEGTVLGGVTGAQMCARRRRRWRRFLPAKRWHGRRDGGAGQGGPRILGSTSPCWRGKRQSVWVVKIAGTADAAIAVHAGYGSYDDANQKALCSGGP